MRYQGLGTLAGTLIAVGDGTAPVGQEYRVDGLGILIGGPGGARGGSIQVAGGMRGGHLDGLGGNPRLTTVPALTQIAPCLERGDPPNKAVTIDFASPNAQLIRIIPGMAKCEVERVSFRNFSSPPPASVMGGIYAAPPCVTASGGQSGARVEVRGTGNALLGADLVLPDGSFIVQVNRSRLPGETLTVRQTNGTPAVLPNFTGPFNPPGAAIVDETTHYDSWLGGVSTFHAPVASAVRQLTKLWFLPRLVDGVASPSLVPLTAEVVISGMPEWAA